MRPKSPAALSYLFRKAFDLSRTYPSQNVMKYCVMRSQVFDVGEKAWPVFEEFLLQTGRANGSTLETVSRILIDRYRTGAKPNTVWVKTFISDLIKKNAPLEHHWELCWLLFLSRELRLELHDDLVEAGENVDSSEVGL